MNNKLEHLEKELNFILDQLDIAHSMGRETKDILINLNNKKSEINKVKLEIENSFYTDIVKNLKSEARIMSENLSKKANKDDFRGYIDMIKSLRETLNLISIYDWKLMYSEYDTEKDGKMIKQITVWEQNHEGKIRNHKEWNTFENYLW